MITLNKFGEGTNPGQEMIHNEIAEEIWLKKRFSADILKFDDYFKQIWGRNKSGARNDT